MSTWPRCPQDYDTVFLNRFNGPLTKTQKFKVYELAFNLACAKLGVTCETDYLRLQLLQSAINEVKK